MVQGHVRDSDGRVFITPECLSLHELEGHSKAPRDDLDQIRERARRVFRQGG
jgi:hypothetical protein